MSIPALVRRRGQSYQGRCACAECGKSERPWRKMMWYPFTLPYSEYAGAYICSDECWERFDER